MSTTFQSHYPPAFYSSDLCQYLGLNHRNKFYKSYILKCLLNKLRNENPSHYYSYKLDNELINIFTNNNINIGWNKYMSKTRLNRTLSYFKKNTFDKKFSKLLVLELFEEGNQTNLITI